MDWNVLQQELIDSAQQLLADEGYRYVKSRKAFVFKSGDCSRFIRLRFVATPTGNRYLEAWCEVQTKESSSVFHRTSGVAKRHQNQYSAITGNSASSICLTAQSDLHDSCKTLTQYIEGSAIPFLTQDFSNSRLSSLLNDAPDLPCRYHANRETRAHFGVIVAQLAGYPKLHELVDVYTDLIAETNNGFYLPRFERLLVDLDMGNPRVTNKDLTSRGCDG
ncbi:hypothetical protein [Rhodopirellula sp. P2]|uniref:hypothetical protein n=1 Tax=Rhodopirellula sp. P2 TaxID=2127060 RepID=UPI002368714B|nr:hypothetical protein [Rhodopirellula sp. P2]WDQ18421.1 hypothetical protein PSR62_07715 [Rhodopirellula sp. P2]